MNVVLYMRCSTAEQVHGMDAQRAQLEEQARLRGWTIAAMCADPGVSGRSMANRVGLAEALALVESGAADAIVVTRLDRLSRSLTDFAALVQRARCRGWNLLILDLGVDLATPAGEFLGNVLASASQYERRLISARVTEALAVAKSKGVRIGRPSSTPADVIERVRRERADGSTWQAIADRLNDDGVPTAQGGRCWYITTVRNLSHGVAMN